MEMDFSTSQAHNTYMSSALLGAHREEVMMSKQRMIFADGHKQVSTIYRRRGLTVTAHEVLEAIQTGKDPEGVVINVKGDLAVADDINSAWPESELTTDEYEILYYKSKE